MENNININQGGNDNINIVNGNNGNLSITVNNNANYDFSNESIINDFSIASGDLIDHKGYFGKNINLRIERKEVIEIENWISNDLLLNENPILAIAGQAGYGKSVVNATII